MASEKQPAPKPTYTVEISVGGCDWERVIEELLRAAEHVREHGTACNQVWGGGGTHGHVQIVQREVIEAQYRDELEAWFQALKASTHTTRDGAFGAWLPSEAARYPIRTPELLKPCPECVGTTCPCQTPGPGGARTAVRPDLDTLLDTPLPPVTTAATRARHRQGGDR